MPFLPPPCSSLTMWSFGSSLVQVREHASSCLPHCLGLDSIPTLSLYRRPSRIQICQQDRRVGRRRKPEEDPSHPPTAREEGVEEHRLLRCRGKPGRRLNVDPMQTAPSYTLWYCDKDLLDSKSGAPQRVVRRVNLPSNPHRPLLSRLQQSQVSSNLL